MNAKEITKDIIETQRLRITDVADRLGVSRQVAWARVNRGEVISLEALTETLRVLDYKIQIVPRNSRLPDGGYEID